MVSCTYEKKDGTQCNHPPLPSSKEHLCIFHENFHRKDPLSCLKKFYNLLEKGETDFEGFRLSNVDLTKRRFERSVNFTYAVFEGTADFRWVTFEGEAAFSQAIFKGNADFRMTRFEKDVNFGETIFNGEADFRWSQFGDYAYFWSADMKKDAYFWMAKFERNANFGEITFSEECSFKDAVFEGDVNFEETKFLKNVVFTRLRCEGEANFDKCSFEGGAFFSNTTFKGSAIFNRCHFLQNGIFEQSSFCSVKFVEAFFEKRGIFNESLISFGNFKGSDLRYVRFDGVDLSNIIFEDAHLEDCYISRGHWYRKEKRKRKQFSSFFRFVRAPIFRFVRGMFSSPVKIREELEMMYGKHICSHCNTVDLKQQESCEGCNRRFVDEMDQEFSCPACGGEVDLDLLMDKYCPRCKIKFSDRNVWKYDKVNRLKRVENVYRSIKQSLENEGDYEKAGEFYINEMYMKRVRYWKRFRKEKKEEEGTEPGLSTEPGEKEEERFYYFWRWLKNLVIWLVTGYGEKPLRTVLTALFVILLFAGFYGVMDAVDGKGDDTDEEMGFTEYIYFSVVTFTTLGYGDYSPKRVWYFQMVATVEAFLGAFTMALFVFVFTRKMAR